MDRLWAPWRMDYIKSSKEEGCIFCKKSDSSSGETVTVLPLDSLYIFPILFRSYPFCYIYTVNVEGSLGLYIFLFLAFVLLLPVYIFLAISAFLFSSIGFLGILAFHCFSIIFV